MNKQMKKYRSAFHNQKTHAKARGIEFKLTFNEWFDWWGEDIDKRGSGHDNLQMQRINDSGPYELGNIRKGTPRDNSRTWSAMHANRKAEKAKREHEQFLDALMYAASKEPHDEALVCAASIECDIKHNGGMPMVAYVIDK